MPHSDNWGAATVREERPAALEVINAEVRGCTKCEELCAKRTQTVFGVGDPSARLVFVGEGPGADEDRIGEPFVGAAGKLLNKILAASKLKREEVYILNTVKCRPPRNRNPKESEIRDCWDYGQRQLEVIQPEFICCLGSVAAKTMLQTTQSLGRLRGKFHPWKGARLIVTYHPAYLLRNEGAKRHVWEDMQLLVKEMGIDLSN
jgi:DNA polymerase